MSITGWIKRKKYFKNNPQIWEQYSEIKRINSSSGYDETLRRFNEIKVYAIKHTQFYSGFSANDKFPVMTKRDFITYYDEIASDESFEGLHMSSTSGSTGVPFTVKQDKYKRNRTIADLKVYGEYAKYPSHEKMLQLRAFNGKELDRSVDRRENIWRYDSSLLNEDRMEDLISFILSWRPRIIFGYVSSLETISDYILNKKDHIHFGCKSVLVGAEMLSEETAMKISKVFECPIYDRYSNMEMGIYAQREFGKTNFIVNKASYYMEILKLDSDEPAEEHEIGRVVFTDLYNRAFPMIRYDTGDLGAYCVRNGEIELETVYGRRVDTICDATGKLINPHSISKSMWGVEGIAQWQFVQKADRHYLLKINASGEINEADILKRLKNPLGELAEISIEYVDEIPVLSSQKRKYIVNEMKR